MINLEVKEIQRYMKLNSLIPEGESDSYSKDMDNLINYLNVEILKTNCFKIKRTEFYGKNLDNLTFKCVRFSSSTIHPKSGYNVYISFSIFVYLGEHFKLSYDSVYNIVRYWLNKRLKKEIVFVIPEEDFSRKAFIKLNK